MIDNDFIWQEGKYLDFWSTTHTIIGAIFVWLFMFLGMNIYLGFLISFLIIFGWEFFELYFLNVHEYFWNKVWDVLTGIIGFWVMYYFILKYGLMNLVNYEIWFIVVYLLLCGWGFWHHYTRKKKNIVS
ncbi:Uncharacterised protein [uncultured archaeon]|nr:Uncharacterised protein [uncultured archaeon]